MGSILNYTNYKLPLSRNDLRNIIQVENDIMFFLNILKDIFIEIFDFNLNNLITKKHYCFSNKKNKKKKKIINSKEKILKLIEQQKNELVENINILLNREQIINTGNTGNIGNTLDINNNPTTNTLLLTTNNLFDDIQEQILNIISDITKLSEDDKKNNTTNIVNIINHINKIFIYLK